MYIKTMAVKYRQEPDGAYSLNTINGNLDEYFFCADSMAISNICGCKIRRMVGDDSLSQYCLVSLTMANGMWSGLQWTQY